MIKAKYTEWIDNYLEGELDIAQRMSFEAEYKPIHNWLPSSGWNRTCWKFFVMKISSISNLNVLKHNKKSISSVWAKPDHSLCTQVLVRRRFCGHHSSGCRRDVCYWIQVIIPTSVCSRCIMSPAKLPSPDQEMSTWSKPYFLQQKGLCFSRQALWRNTGCRAGELCRHVLFRDHQHWTQNYDQAIEKFAEIIDDGPKSVCRKRSMVLGLYISSMIKKLKLWSNSE